MRVEMKGFVVSCPRFIGWLFPVIPSYSALMAVNPGEKRPEAGRDMHINRR
jgi:hypothetical protein